MRSIRWGVLGAGDIAVTRTIPGILKAEHAELRAVMNTGIEKARRVQEKFGAASAYDSAEALLLDPEVDAVYIASPVFMHTKLALQAAARGKHVLCEKPLGLNAQDALCAVKGCREKGVTLSVGFMMRYGAQLQNMKRLISEGRLGKVVSAESRFSMWLPYRQGNWLHTRAKAGGGPIMDMGIHCIDIMQYVTGLRATHVTAMQEKLAFAQSDYDVDDTSTLIMRMENGAQFIVATNFNIPEPASNWTLNFYGTEGRLLGDEVIGQEDGGRLNAVLLRPGDPHTGQTSPGIAVEAEFGDMYEREIERFSLALLERRSPDIDPLDAVWDQMIIDAACRSAETGRVVELPEYPAANE